MLERPQPILLYSTKFSEIKAVAVKFPEFKKLPENLHPRPPFTVKTDSLAGSTI